MNLLDRIAADPVPYAMRVIALLAVVGMIVLAFGCASTPERYLSEEEDAKMRRICEAAGCVTVPVPIWQNLLELVQRMRGA